MVRSQPSWYSASDTERVEWLNTVLDTAWPHVNEAVSKLIKDEIVGALLDAIPGVRMTAFTLGTVPLKICGVRANQSSFDSVVSDKLSTRGG